MMILPLIFLIAALILFAIATWWGESPIGRYSLVAAGLFCWVLSELLQKYAL